MYGVEIHLQQNEATARAWYITDLPTAHDRIMDALDRLSADFGVTKITPEHRVKIHA